MLQKLSILFVAITPLKVRWRLCSLSFSFARCLGARGAKRTHRLIFYISTDQSIAVNISGDIAESDITVCVSARHRLLFKFQLKVELSCLQ